MSDTRLFEPMFRSVRLLRLPKEGGMEPCRLLFCRWRSSRLARFPREEGRGSGSVKSMLERRR